MKAPLSMRLKDGLLTCPSCRKGFLAVEDRPALVVCRRCSASCPVHDGVIDLLPGLPHTRSLAQKAMEAGPIVRIYESRLWRRSPLFAAATRIPFDREKELIMSAIDVHGCETVLDLACGTGIYTRPIAASIPEGVAVGLDLSLPMLRHARRRSCTEGLENVLFVRGSALDLPFPDGRLDAVLCCGALHMFPDTSRVLVSVCRILKSGGRFAVAVFRRGDSRVARLRARVRRALYDIASFTFEWLQTRLHDSGFQNIERHHDKGLWLIVSGRKP
jgi:SAM-dependent methyltransferase